MIFNMKIIRIRNWRKSLIDPMSNGKVVPTFPAIA